jgi:hypothetical protein
VRRSGVCDSFPDKMVSGATVIIVIGVHVKPPMAPLGPHLIASGGLDASHRHPLVQQYAAALVCGFECGRRVPELVEQRGSLLASLGMRRLGHIQTALSE